MKKWDIFERGVVFRVSRGLYLTLAILITAGLLGSLGMFLYSVSPTMRGAMPDKPTPPTPPSITVAEINEELAGPDVSKMVALQERPPTEPEPEFIPADVDPDRRKILEMKQKLRETYFPIEGFPWDSIFGQVCTNSWGNHCFNWQTKETKAGVSSLIDRGIQELNPELSIQLLQDMTDLLAMAPQNDNSRYIAARSIVDISRAFNEPPQIVYDEIGTILRGGTAKTEAAKLTPPTDEEKDLLFNVLYAIKKADSKTTVLTEYLRQWKQLAGLFPADMREEALSIAWFQVKYAHAEQAPAMLAAIVQTVQGLDEAQRKDGLIVYARLMSEKMRSTQMQYDREMSDYNLAVNEREAAYLQKKMKKTAYTGKALYGVGVAVGGIALIGLLLGLLGIERNTRTLEQLLSLQMQSMPGVAATMPAQKPAQAEADAEGASFNNRH